MVIVAVDSVFQLVCALNIAYDESPDQNYILLLRSNFWNSQKKFNVFESLLVHKIYYTKEKYNDVSTMRRWLLYSKLCPQAAVFKFFDQPLPTEKATTIIAASCVDYLVPLFKFYNFKRTKLFLVEEGIGEYISLTRSNAKRTIKGTIKSYFSGRTKLGKIAVRRFLVPDLILNKKTRILNAPFMSTDTRFVKGLQALFNSEHDIIKLRNFSTIYFEQPFANEHDCNETLYRQFSGAEDKIVKRCSILPGFLIKSYPRSASIPSPMYNSISTGAPWEAVMLPLKMENIVLISISSTSIISPKLFLDKEPIVICLINIFQGYLIGLTPTLDHKHLTRTRDFFYYVKNMYRNPGRFYIPNSLSELDEVLNTLTSQPI